MRLEPDGPIVTGDSADPRHAVVREFVHRYGRSPSFVARAPGRVNLIGEHTDYNEGFALPVAINRAVWIAFSRMEGDRVAVQSREFASAGEFRFGEPAKTSDGWIAYVRGVAWALSNGGFALSGWRGVVASNVPVGAGLSFTADRLTLDYGAAFYVGNKMANRLTVRWR